MSNVAYLPGPTQPAISKKQLGQVLGRSNKWIELRVREGMPRVAPTARFPRPRYRLDEVEAWFADGQRPKQPPTNERLAALERTAVDNERVVTELRSEVAELRAELDELKAPGAA